jgi:hypothetical protein
MVEGQTCPEIEEEDSVRRIMIERFQYRLKAELRGPPGQEVGDGVSAPVLHFRVADSSKEPDGVGSPMSMKSKGCCARIQNLLILHLLRPTVVVDVVKGFCQ